MEFCEKEEAGSGVFALAGELQSLACSLVEEGFSLCGADPMELHEQGDIFSPQFRRRTSLPAQCGWDGQMAAVSAQQAYSSASTRWNPEPEKTVQQTDHIYEARRTEQPTIAHLGRSDIQAAQFSTGVALPTVMVEQGASMSAGFSSSLGAGGLENSSYPAATANLGNWRPADENQYPRQELTAAELEWMVWWVEYSQSLGYPPV